jgi:hypothetical protein
MTSGRTILLWSCSPVRRWLSDHEETTEDEAIASPGNRDALEAAHEGNIHRDQPENIRSSRRYRQVSISDWLKLPTHLPPAAHPPISRTPHTKHCFTHGGRNGLGTAGYIVPSRANQDKLSDIWALDGALRTAGRRAPVRGEDARDAAVIKEEPNLTWCQCRAICCGVFEIPKRLRDIADARLLLDNPVPLLPKQPWPAASAPPEDGLGVSGTGGCRPGSGSVFRRTLREKPPLRADAVPDHHARP